MKLLLYALMIQSVVSDIIKGFSYTGLEAQMLDCSWKHPPEFYIDKTKELGFNYIRLPFSAQYVQAGNWTMMDRVFESAHFNNMSILLDYHRTYSSHQGDFSETNLKEFLKTWRVILERYYYNPVLQGVGVFNEYQQNDADYWNKNMRTAVENIEHAFPNRFWYLVGCPRWSGHCGGMSLEDLPYADRIRYDIHKYIFSGTGDQHDWNLSFGDLNISNKIIVGEWGFISSQPEQVAWANRFVDYLIQKNIRNTFFWVVVFSSGDTGGIWKDCDNIDQAKIDLIHRLWGVSSAQEEWIIDAKNFNASETDTTTDEDWRKLQFRQPFKKKHRCVDLEAEDCIEKEKCCYNIKFHCWRCVE